MKMTDEQRADFVAMIQALPPVPVVQPRPPPHTYAEQLEVQRAARFAMKDRGGLYTTVRLSPAVMAALKEIRREIPGLPDRSEAIELAVLQLLHTLSQPQ